MQNTPSQKCSIEDSDELSDGLVEFLIIEAKKKITNQVQDIDALDKKGFALLAIIFTLVSARMIWTGHEAWTWVASAISVFGAMAAAYFALEAISPRGYSDDVPKLSEVLKYAIDEKADLNKTRKKLLENLRNGFNENQDLIDSKSKPLKHSITIFYWTLLGSGFIHFIVIILY